MARDRGTFTAAANYEPLKAAPFDARQLVDTKIDLISPDTWQQINGDTWVYVGMLVTVARDSDVNNNGTYRLIQLPYTDINNWIRQADNIDIQHLQAQIDDIEIVEGGTGIEVEEIIDLPKVGMTGATYYVKENSGIYRWNEKTQSYDSYGGVGEIPELNIKIIYGGNAHGTD